jgi:hypothetical protein
VAESDGDLVPTGPEASPPEPVVPGPSAVVQSEIEDLKRELKATRRKSRMHFMWLLLGISPGAILPALGLLGEGRTDLLVIFLIMVAASQLYLGMKAATKMDRLKARLNELEGELEGGPSALPPA